jgi:hypothetical protein
MRVEKGFGFGQRIKNAECDQCAVVADLFRPPGSGCQRVATHSPPMDSRNLSCAAGVMTNRTAASLASVVKTPSGLP